MRKGSGEGSSFLLRYAPFTPPPPIFFARPCVAPALFLLGLKETEMTAKLVNVFVMLEITIKSATF